MHKISSSSIREKSKASVQCYWQNFAQGFRSRVNYWSILEPNARCDYVSEILDAGIAGPLFMVSVEGKPSEVFVHVCPERYWDLVVQKVNAINKIFYQDNKRRGRPSPLFPVQKPGSIDGLEMFVLSASSVLQALEALDTKQVSEYCRFWDQSKGEASSLGASEVHHQNPLVRRTAPSAPAGNPSLILHELFKKANPVEIRALEIMFRDVPSSSNSRQEVVLLLFKEIRSRHHWQNVLVLFLQPSALMSSQQE